MSAQSIVERIAITWVEGRLENVLERQKQLAALHQSLYRRFDDCARALQQGESLYRLIHVIPSTQY